MTRVTRRTTGWLAIVFVVLLFLSAGMVTLPSSTQSPEVTADFYAANRWIIIIVQAFGLIAAPVFIAFALGVQNSMSSVHASDRIEAMGLAGILVGMVSLVTAVPVIVLSLTTYNLPFWVRMTDLSDAILFLAIAVFCASSAVRGDHAPVWWRAVAALAGLFAMVRSIAGFVRATSVLDLAAPLAFITFILVTGIYLLLSARRENA
jgi:hypothetical protein